MKMLLNISEKKKKSLFLDKSTLTNAPSKAKQDT